MTTEQILQKAQQELLSIDKEFSAFLQNPYITDCDELDAYCDNYCKVRNTLHRVIFAIQQDDIEYQRLVRNLYSFKNYMNWLAQNEKTLDFKEKHGVLKAEIVKSKRDFFKARKEEVQAIITGLEQTISAL